MYVLHTKFDTARDDLLTSGLYLGDQIFEINEVIWQCIDTDNCLVTKESPDAVDADNSAYATMETTPREESTLSPTPEYNLAVLSAIVHITDDDDFWITSCRNWKGTSQYC